MESAGKRAPGWQLVLPYLIAIHYRHYGNVNLLAESLPFLEKQILSPKCATLMTGDLLPG